MQNANVSFLGLTLESFADKLGNVVASKDELGLAVLSEYDVAGRKTAEVIDMNGNNIRDLGDRGTVWSNRFVQFNGADVFESLTYAITDSNTLKCVGRSLTRLDGKGGWSIDAAGVTQSTFAAYQSATQKKITTTYPDGNTSEMTSNCGLLKSTKNRSNQTTTFAQEGFNRLKSSTDSAIRTTTHTYGPNDVSETVRTPDGKQTTTTFNEFGETAAFIDKDGSVSTNKYLETGDLEKKWGGKTPPMVNAWDGAGHKKALSTYRNWTPSALSGGFAGQPDTTSWDRDPRRGWVTAKVYSDGRRYVFSRSVDGQITNTTDPRGVQISFQRNPAHELVCKRFSDTTPAVTNVYDYLGNKTNIIDASGKRVIVYNDRGQEVQITATGGRVGYTLGYGYKLETSARTNLTLTLGSVVTRVDYSYDAWGRLSGIKPGFTNASFNYVRMTNTDVIASLTYPNNISVQYAYPSNSFLLTSITNRRANGTILSRFDYSYNSGDQCTNVARLYESRNAAYTYDSYGQLASAVSKYAGTSTTNEWLFDSAGNRLADSAGSLGTERGYVNNNLNQMLAVTSSTAVVTFGVDANGNMTSAGNTVYSWDAENRMTGMSNALQKAVCKYDSEGRRFYKRVDNWTGSAWQLSAETDFIYDGWLPLAEIVNNGATVTTNIYVWGLDKSGSLSGSGGIGGLLSRYSLQGATKTTSYYLSDKQGNVMTMLDASGTNVMASYEYSAFGECISATGPLATNNNFRWSSKYWDKETGLGYWGYRYYSATYGRWWSRDPKQEEGGPNLYGYCGNAPCDKVDPLGLESEWAVGIGLALGFQDGDFSVRWNATASYAITEDVPGSSDDSIRCGFDVGLRINTLRGLGTSHYHPDVSTYDLFAVGSLGIGHGSGKETPRYLLSTLDDSLLRDSFDSAFSVGRGVNYNSGIGLTHAGFFDIKGNGTFFHYNNDYIPLVVGRTDYSWTGGNVIGHVNAGGDLMEIGFEAFTGAYDTYL